MKTTRLVVLLLGTALCFSIGQTEGSSPENCSMWYYSMPRSILCREGTHFSTACQVQVPCDIETEVDWYWSPLNKSNVTHLFNDSNSNGAHVRALISPKEMCGSFNITAYDGTVITTSASLQHLYTLTLTGLSSDNAGYYWCQLRVVDTQDSMSGVVERNLLPSNLCYVDINDTGKECEYGDHKDIWNCAENLTSSTVNSLKQMQSELVTATQFTVSTILSSPIQTVSLSTNNKDSPFFKLQVRVIEVAFIAVIVICMLIITSLIGCLVYKHRKRKRTEDSQMVIDVQQKNDRKETTPDETQPRYTPVNTLTRTLSVPQLTSEWCRSYSNDKLLSEEDPIYSSPYQHLNATDMDYTSMYSKLHQHNKVTVSKSTEPKNSVL